MASERKGLTPEQIEDIRTKWRQVGDAVQAGKPLNEVGLLLWYAEHVGDLLSTTDRLTAALAARDAQIERIMESAVRVVDWAGPSRPDVAWWACLLCDSEEAGSREDVVHRDGCALLAPGADAGAGDEGT